MKRSPHTHFSRGKTVRVALTDGSVIVSKFVERRSRDVVLESGKIPVASIKAMSQLKRG